MKKFLFVLCFALVSKSLFSASFKKEFCEPMVKDFFTDEFLAQVSDIAGSTECLKQIAGKYLELLRKNKNYNDALKELNAYIENNVFKLNNEDAFYVPYILQEKMQQWLEQLKAEVENPEELIGYEELSNSVQVTTSFETRSVEAIADYAEKKVTKIFTQILIKLCDERIEAKRKADLKKKAIKLGITSGALVLGLVGVGSMIYLETRPTIDPNKNAFKYAVELVERIKILNYQDEDDDNTPIDTVDAIRNVISPTQNTAPIRIPKLKAGDMLKFVGGVATAMAIGIFGADAAARSGATAGTTMRAASLVGATGTTVAILFAIAGDAMNDYTKKAKNHRRT